MDDEFRVVQDPSTGQIHFVVDDSLDPLELTQCGDQAGKMRPVVEWPVSLTQVCRECCITMGFMAEVDRKRKAALHG